MGITRYDDAPPVWYYDDIVPGENLSTEFFFPHAEFLDIIVTNVLKVNNFVQNNHVS